MDRRAVYHILNETCTFLDVTALGATAMLRNMTADFVLGLRKASQARVRALARSFHAPAGAFPRLE